MYAFWSTQYKDICSNALAHWNCKQHRCPPVENWANMLAHIHMAKCYMAIKKTEEDRWLCKKKKKDRFNINNSSFYAKPSISIEKIWTNIGQPVNSQSEAAQSCLTLCNPMDCSPRNFLGKSSGVGCHFLLQGIFLTQGSNPGLLHRRHRLYLWATREAQKKCGQTYVNL